MILRITPFDTLFFRTGRPFELGEDRWAESIFPPYPSTIYGAIRTFLIFNKPDGLKGFYNGKYEQELGTPDKKGTLKIKGPIIFKKNEFYIKIPYDLIKLKTEEKYKRLTLLDKQSLFISDLFLSKVLTITSNEPVEEAKGYLSEANIFDYMKGIKDEFDVIPDDSLFLIEHKIGIRRDKIRLTSQEHQIYSAPMIRLKKGVSIIAEIEGINEIQEGVFTLGGDGKVAKLETEKDDLLKNIKNVELKFKNKIFKIIFLTPTIFKNGWLPDWIDEKTLKGTFKGIELKLLSCAIGKHLYIGGFDIKKKMPKPMYKAVPAGSVYYFEFKKSSPEEIKKLFHFQTISDINSEQGFGLSILGEVQ